MEHGADIWSTVIFPYANFAMFLAVAVYLMRKPLMKMAADKRETYLAFMKEAQAVKEAAEAAFNAAKSRADNLDKELATIRNDRINAAKQEAESIVVSAKKLAEHITAEAQRIIKNEIEKARTELRDELIDKAINRATEKLQTKLTRDEHLKLVTRNIDEISALPKGVRS